MKQNAECVCGKIPYYMPSSDREVTAAVAAQERVLIWNVAGRGKKVAAQIDAIKSIDADVVALQEVTQRSLASILTGLVELG